MAEKFTQHTGLVVPLDAANVDTDAIIPKQFLQKVTRTGFGAHLFNDWRFLDEKGQQPNPEFVLNFPEYKGASILLARQQIGNCTYFTFGVIQLTPQQRFQRLTVQEKHRAAPAFDRQTIIAELIEIFTDRVARQPEVKANGFRRKCRLLRQIGKIQPARQPFEFPQYYLNPSHLFTA